MSKTVVHPSSLLEEGGAGRGWEMEGVGPMKRLRVFFPLKMSGGIDYSYYAGKMGSQ